MNWHLGTRRPFGSYVFFWMALGLLALTVLLTVGAAASRSRDQWVVRTLVTLQHLEHYEAGLLQAELRSRNGFQSEEAHGLALSGLDKAQESINRLMDISRDNSRQVIRLKVLQSLTNQFARTIRERGAHSVSLADLPLAETVSEFRSEEQVLLQKRQQDREAADTAFWRLTAFALATNLGLIWWVYQTSRRYIRERTSQMEITMGKLRSSTAELERFAYVASHDLQEPLRQVASFNSLLALKYGGQLDATARHYLSCSVDGAKRLQLMLQALLQYAVVSSSQIRRVEMPVTELVRNMRHDLRPEITEACAAIEVNAGRGASDRGRRRDDSNRGSQEFNDRRRQHDSFVCLLREVLQLLDAEAVVLD